MEKNEGEKEEEEELRLKRNERRTREEKKKKKEKEKEKKRKRKRNRKKKIRKTGGRCGMKMSFMKFCKWPVRPEAGPSLMTFRPSENAVTVADI